jgi:hypothetical protein
MEPIEEDAAMTEYRTIDIDFDVSKLIETERRSFEDTPNAALRRLLKLPAKTERDVPKPSAGRAWSADGAFLPHGTKARMTYGQQRIDAEIVDGRWVGDGQTFDSPSAAASGLARTKKGTTTSLNGWDYWEVKTPSSTSWEKLSSRRGRG